MDGRSPEGANISPAYDVTHAHSAESRWTRQNLMAVNGRVRDITRADVLEVGDRFAVPQVSAAIDQVLDATSRWAVFASEAGVPKAIAQSVVRDIKQWSLPLR